eukprot:6189807-Pleurochrysis_carterae.AAC.1
MHRAAERMFGSSDGARTAWLLIAAVFSLTLSHSRSLTHALSLTLAHSSSHSRSRSRSLTHALSLSHTLSLICPHRALSPFSCSTCSDGKLRVPAILGTVIRANSHASRIFSSVSD